MGLTPLAAVPSTRAVRMRSPPAVRSLQRLPPWQHSARSPAISIPMQHLQMSGHHPCHPQRPDVAVHADARATQRMPGVRRSRECSTILRDMRQQSSARSRSVCLPFRPCGAHTLTSYSPPGNRCRAPPGSGMCAPGHRRLPLRQAMCSERRHGSNWLACRRTLELEPETFLG